MKTIMTSFWCNILTIIIIIFVNIIHLEVLDKYVRIILQEVLERIISYFPWYDTERIENHTYK
jgi:hypothetical protein